MYNTTYSLLICCYIIIIVVVIIIIIIILLLLGSTLERTRLLLRKTSITWRPAIRERQLETTHSTLVAGRPARDMGNVAFVPATALQNTTCNNRTIEPAVEEIMELHDLFDLLACVLTVCGLVGLINHPRINCPLPISLSLTALLMSLVLIAIDGVNDQMPIRSFITKLLAHGEFGDIVLSFGVGFLLFAAAMESNIKSMGHRWSLIVFLSVAGVLASVSLIGTVLYGTFVSFGFYEPTTHNFLLCLLFGAIVSSTEIHKFVLESLEEANAPDAVSAIILGESLLNDGVAVVLFIIFKKLIDEPLQHNDASHGINSEEVWSDIVKDLFGGIFIGVFFAMVFGAIMKKVRSPNLNTLISVILVLDVTMVANRLESSSPMACVCAGLTLRSMFYEKFERRSQQDLDTIWYLLRRACPVFFSS